MTFIFSSFIIKRYIQTLITVRKDRLMNDSMKKALEEYNSDVTTAHHGGVNGRPFWNANSPHFLFNPAFLFPQYHAVKEYLFTATDENGKEYSFTSSKSTSLLTPIWKDIPVGMVTLRVDALDANGNVTYPVGVRTFYKSAPFPGRDAYEPAARSYAEAAKMGYRFVFELPMAKYLLKHGTPDPEYDYNVYPSKMLRSIISAMLSYAQLEPSAADEAIEIAKKAADYLISISYKDDSPVRGLPPTYYVDFRPKGTGKTNYTADDRGGNIMMIYPPEVGKVYLALERYTGEKRYLDAAIKIADYLCDTILPEGSWPLFINTTTGEPVTFNLCGPDRAMDFLADAYNRTGNEKYRKTENLCYQYVINKILPIYNWEGQFEDAPFSNNYSNLTHFGATALIDYLAQNRKDDPESALIAADLIRFVEDQFAVWGKPSPCIHPNVSDWLYPSAFEQYEWLRPIDGSAASLIKGFTGAYILTKNPLLLEKAHALADMITKVQNPTNGAIPTYWTKKNCGELLEDFWINCHIGTTNQLFTFNEQLKNLK